MDIAKPGLILLYLSLFLLAAYYKHQQDQNQMGGKIAYSKSLWLMYCLFSWFILPIYFLIYPTNSDFSKVYALFGLSFWIRGIAEMLMLYKFKNWKPIYGITHNIFSFILLSVLMLFFRENIFPFEILHFFSLLISLSFECYFAFFFKKYIGEKTQGEEAIWFANSEDPLFAFNLKVTRVAVVLLYSELALAMLFL